MVIWSSLTHLFCHIWSVKTMLPLSKSNMWIVNTMYELLNFFFTYSSQKEKIGIDLGNSKSVIWVNNIILQYFLWNGIFVRLFANKDWKESSCFNMGRSFHSLFRLLPATSQRKISQHHWKEGVVISKAAN